ncbi:MAG: ABC transporter ATP-binding protein [Bacteroidota bacterium]
MPASLLSASSLSVALGGAPVLRDLALDVREGEWLGVVGPNGAGKSTLLRTVAGLLPYAGSLTLREREVRDWPGRERAREVALVRQQTDLPFAFSVREVVAMGRAPHLGWLSPLGSDDRERVEAAIEALGLGDLARRPVTALSGGEQQRVLLAQALAQDAPLLLLDEPTAHLDVRHRLDLLDHVRQWVGDGHTVISALHDLEWAARYADRVLVLRDGEIAALGSPEDVLTQALLADVFGVEAEVSREPSGLRIRYLAAHPHLPS